MKNEPLIIQCTLNAAIPKVWKAITEKTDMKQWYFDFAEFKTEVGFEFQFLAGKEEKKYMHLCKIIEVIPGEKLSYSWRYEGFEGNSIVTFELFPESDKTKIILTHEGLETFPASNTDFAKENFVVGWSYIIRTALKDFVELSTL